jgi:uncharacterized protein (TIGR03067 family)
MMKKALGFGLGALLLIGGAQADEKKVLDELKGTWAISELTWNGKDYSKLKFNFVFKGNEVVVEGNDLVKVEYARLKVKIDPATMPKIFDITVGDGVQKGATMEGIYELKGKELKICLKVFGKDRPAEFGSAAGSSVALLVLKRPNQ